MKLTIVIVLSLVLLLVSACAGGNPSPTTNNPTVISPGTASPTPAPAPVASPTAAATSSPPAISSAPSSSSPAASPTAQAGPPPGAVQVDAVNSSSLNFPGETVAIKAYQAWPKSPGPYPALIVIHENRGLTEHIKDVTRRFANQGYLALGVDLLSRVGGREAFATDEAATAAINQLTSEGVMQDMASAMKYLKGLPDIKMDRIGVIGYCWGGGNSLLFSTRSNELSTAVVYYGPNPTNIDDVETITAPVLGIYGAEDTRITVNVPALEAAMKKYNKRFEYKIYPGAAHAFFNDTGARYHPQASADAWIVTTAFLKKHLQEK